MIECRAGSIQNRDVRPGRAIVAIPGRAGPAPESPSSQPRRTQPHAAAAPYRERCRRPSLQSVDSWRPRSDPTCAALIASGSTLAARRLTQSQRCCQFPARPMSRTVGEFCWVLRAICACTAASATRGWLPLCRGFTVHRTAASIARWSVGRSQSAHDVPIALSFGQGKNQPGAEDITGWKHCAHWVRSTRCSPSGKHRLIPSII